MDTSEQYIKMCDCPEIQGKWEIGVDEKMHPTTDPHDYTQMILKPHPKYKTQQACITIWLPRQDQIQEMVSRSWVIGFEGFNEWYFNKSYPQKTYPNDTFASMEQMWLAFYMSKNHHKIWDGEKWIK